MRNTREEIDWKEVRFRLLSDKVDKNKMVYAEMAASLQGLQAGEERRGSNGSRAVDCCMETMVEQFFAMGADQARTRFDAMCQPGTGGRRNGEDDQEQDKASQQLASSASGGCNEGTPVSSE